MDLSTVRKNMAGIYKITCPDGCIYIGQSNDIKERLWGYRSKNKAKNKIHNSIDGKGIKNHSFEIIHIIDETLPFEELKMILNELEINYIKNYDCFDTPYGLNSTSGGSSKSKMSKETKQKLSESHKGQVAWNKGVPMTAEAKAKISGVNNPMYGKKGELNHNYGRKHTDEQRKANSDMLFGIKKSYVFGGAFLVLAGFVYFKYIKK